MGRKFAPMNDNACFPNLNLNSNKLFPSSISPSRNLIVAAHKFIKTDDISMKMIMLQPIEEQGKYKKNELNRGKKLSTKS